MSTTKVEYICFNSLQSEHVLEQAIECPVWVFCVNVLYIVYCTVGACHVGMWISCNMRNYSIVGGLEQQ